ncbi:cell division protein sepF [Clostridium sp. CAG:628]|jgi:cell division inhibitor SepF|nr:cell division protein sepF [Clostridium sp. CAG:628]
MAFGKFKIFETDDDVVTTNDEEYYSVSSEEVKKGATGKMILVEPRAYSESQEIADHLKSRNSVVVNFKRVTNDQAKRIIDFLSGTLYAIGGDLQKIGEGIYLCTPKNIDVQGEITEESSEDENGENW